MPPFEKEYFRKDGTRVPILLGAVSFDEYQSQGVAFVLDLTERKRAEEATPNLSAPDRILAGLDGARDASYTSAPVRNRTEALDTLVLAMIALAVRQAEQAFL